MWYDSRTVFFLQPLIFFMQIQHSALYFFHELFLYSCFQFCLSVTCVNILLSKKIKWYYGSIKLKSGYNMILAGMWSDIIFVMVPYQFKVILKRWCVYHVMTTKYARYECFYLFHLVSKNCNLLQYTKIIKHIILNKKKMFIFLYNLFT